jgi:hypothetical protein
MKKRVAKKERGKNVLECNDPNSALQARLELLQHALLQVLREAVVVQEHDRRLATRCHVSDACTMRDQSASSSP